MAIKILNPAYQRIPNYHEIENPKKYFEKCNKIPILVEEKIDGKTIDGARACANIQDYEICLFGEFLEDTHLIRYKNLPDKKIFFDIIIEGEYLTPKQKNILLVLLGLVPAPIVYIFEGYKNLTEDYVRDLYLKRKSYFETELNPKICKKFKHLCEDFEQKYGKGGFSEGIVLKCYNNGKLLAIKYVKPEFDKIIKIVGHYEKYPQKNIIKYDIKFAKEIVKNNLTLLNFSENEKGLLLNLFERSFPFSFKKIETEEIIKENPNLTIIEKILNKIKKEKYQ